MAKPRHDWLDRLVYLALRLLAMVLYWFPVNTGLSAARVAGMIFYWIDKKHRQRALSNLEHAFPEWSLNRRQRIARRSVQHMFMLAAEALYTVRLIRLETWRDYVQIDGIQQTLQLLMDNKKGLIMLTGHYGNWEILGYLLATLGFETHSVARAIDNPYIDQWVFGFRAKRGQKMVGKKGATGEVTEILDKGGVVAFVADQNAGSKGIFVDFFGRKASTYKSIGLLAMHYEIPVVVGYARRIGNRFQFQIAAADVIQPQDWKDQPDPLRYITQRYTKAIEDFVRVEPEQYFWVHRRWKSRPKGEITLAQDG